MRRLSLYHKSLLISFNKFLNLSPSLLFLSLFIFVFFFLLINMLGGIDWLVVNE